MYIAANVFYFPWEFSFLDGLWKLHGEVLDRVMTTLTSLGNAGILWILLTLALLISKRYRACGLAMAAALVCSLILGNGIIKNLVQRARPCWINEAVQAKLLIAVPQDFSFPSGHTMASFAAATALFLHHRKWGLAAMAVGLAIGFTRLYLYVHWPTDVLAGILLGILWGILGYQIAKKLTKTK